MVPCPAPYFRKLACAIRQVTPAGTQDLLRHKTIAMTERYAHLIPENSQAKQQLSVKSLQETARKPRAAHSHSVRTT